MLTDSYTVAFGGKPHNSLPGMWHCDKLCHCRPPTISIVGGCQYVGTTYHTSRKTLITPKGQVYLAKKVSKEYKG